MTEPEQCRKPDADAGADPGDNTAKQEDSRQADAGGQSITDQLDQSAIQQQQQKQQ